MGGGGHNPNPNPDLDPPSVTPNPTSQPNLGMNSASTKEGTS